MGSARKAESFGTGEFFTAEEVHVEAKKLLHYAKMCFATSSEGEKSVTGVEAKRRAEMLYAYAQFLESCP